jgi:hypothetical protein
MPQPSLLDRLFRGRKSNPSSSESRADLDAIDREIPAKESELASIAADRGRAWRDAEQFDALSKREADIRNEIDRLRFARQDFVDQLALAVAAERVEETRSRVRELADLAKRAPKLVSTVNDAVRATAAAMAELKSAQQRTLSLIRQVSDVDGVTPPEAEAALSKVPTAFRSFSVLDHEILLSEIGENGERVRVWPPVHHLVPMPTREQVDEETRLIASGKPYTLVEAGNDRSQIVTPSDEEVAAARRRIAAVEKHNQQLAQA